MRTYLYTCRIYAAAVTGLNKSYACNVVTGDEGDWGGKKKWKIIHHNDPAPKLPPRRTSHSTTHVMITQYYWTMYIRYNTRIYGFALMRLLMFIRVVFSVGTYGFFFFCVRHNNYCVIHPNRARIIRARDRTTYLLASDKTGLHVTVGSTRIIASALS